LGLMNVPHAMDLGFTQSVALRTIHFLAKMIKNNATRKGGIFFGSNFK